MFKLCVLVSILVAFVGANYNFQDSDFNQLLYDDLTAAVDNDDELLRLRRAADPKQCHRKKIKSEDENNCCGAEGKQNQKDLDAFGEAKKNCVAEVRATHANHQHDPLKCDSVLTLRQQMVCTGECLAKVFHLIEDNGDLKRNALLNHTRKIIGENTWKAAVLEEYLDKCLHELNASKGVIKSDTSKDGTCNSSPLDVRYCIWKKLVQGCPAQMQVDNEKCKRIRLRLAKDDASSAEKTPKSSSHNKQ